MTEKKKVRSKRWGFKEQEIKDSDGGGGGGLGERGSGGDALARMVGRRTTPLMV